MITSAYFDKASEILSKYESEILQCNAEVIKSCLRYITDVRLANNYYELIDAHRTVKRQLETIATKEEVRQLNHLFWRSIINRLIISGAIWVFWGGLCAVGFVAVYSLIGGIK